MAQNRGAGPIPLAAAHAAAGLHVLLGVIAAGQDAGLEQQRNGQWR